MPGATSIFEHYRDRSRGEWERDLTQSLNKSDVAGLQFPTFPDAALQNALHGSSGPVALREALLFSEYVTSVISSVRDGLGRDDVLLDFGAGWGRISRAFMRDVPAAQIFALEPHDQVFDIRKHNPFINSIQINELPPTPLRSESATCVVSWSTFTHFSPRLFNAWIEEFARLLAPGGFCAVSLLGHRFLERIRQGHEKKSKGLEIHWWLDLVLQRMPLTRIEETAKRIDCGHHVFCPSDNVRNPDFAEGFATDKFFAQNFDNFFEIIDYRNSGDLGQDCIVLRRR